MNTNQAKNEDTQQSDDFKPITSQADLDKIIQARLAREREKYADYNDLKNKVTELTEANTAIEGERADLETKLQTIESDAAVKDAALKYGLAVDDLDFIRGGSNDDVEERAKRFADRVKNTFTPPQDSSSDRTPDRAANSDAEKFIEQLFGGKKP